MTYPPDNTSILNVCVVPPERVGNQCAAISRSLTSPHTLFTLGRDKFAHMTLFMARFPDQSVERVIRAAERVIAQSRTFPCLHSGYFLTDGRYLEVSYRRSQKFAKLHKQLIAALKEFRSSPGQPYAEGYFAPYTAEQQINAATTGYDLAYRLFRPHITLTRYAEGVALETFPSLPDASLSFDLETVCLYRADDNGAVYERLAQFSVAKN